MGCEYQREPPAGRLSLQPNGSILFWFCFVIVDFFFFYTCFCTKFRPEVLARETEDVSKKC